MNIDIQRYKLSFIVPAYNCQNFLVECVESIINQKLDDYEIIIVNDGSSDDTLIIADSLKYKYPNKIKVFSKKNGGAASARNYGLSKALGLFIIFVDADDMIYNSDLETSILMIEKENVDILLSDMALLFNKKIIRNESTNNQKKVNGKILQYISTLKKFPGSSCSKIFKRSFLIQNDLLFTENIVNEDIDFMISCFKKSTSIFHSDLSWYIYRQNVENSVTNIINSKNCIDMFKIMDKFLLNDKESEKKSLEKIFCYEYCTLFFYYYRLSFNDQAKLKHSFDKYKYLLKCGNKLYLVIYFIYMILGLNKLSAIIFYLYKLKRRINHVFNK
ncbi:glycosyltransferase family 2 protein [[Clostridium] innocuum]|nr:glycosyltransferase family 2 protein [[Clostridium] innocuum]